MSAFYDWARPWARGQWWTKKSACSHWAYLHPSSPFFLVIWAITIGHRLEGSRTEWESMNQGAMGKCGLGAWGKTYGGTSGRGSLLGPCLGPFAASPGCPWLWFSLLGPLHQRTHPTYLCRYLHTCQGALPYGAERDSTMNQEISPVKPEVSQLRLDFFLC